MIQSAIRGRQREIVNLKDRYNKFTKHRIYINTNIFVSFFLISYTIDKEY